MEISPEIQKYARSKPFLCCITGEAIQPERVEYLLSDGVPESELKSLRGSEMTYRSRKIIVVDDEANEFICTKIDNARAWERERFGGVPEDESDEVEVDEVKAKKKKKPSEDGLPLLAHEDLGKYIELEENKDTEENEI